MMEPLEPLNIVLQECKENYLRDLVNQFVSSLESEGFTLTEVVDALTNYIWVNTNSTDAVFFLMKASLALRNTDTNPRS